MKNIKLFLIGLLLLIISLVYTKEISLYKITPSLLLPWVIYISIQLDYRVSLSFAFFFSLANELLNPQLIGFTSILYVILSHFISKHHASFNKDKYSTILFSLFVINFLFYMVQWLYFSFTSPEPWFLFQKTAITIVYNTLISAVIIFLIFITDKIKVSFHD